MKISKLTKVELVTDRSEFCGIVSLRMLPKTAKVRNNATDIPIFSPDLIGNKKQKQFMIDKATMGTIIVSERNNGLLLKIINILSMLSFSETLVESKSHSSFPI